MRLRTISEELNWIDPDKLYMKNGAVTFIFTEYNELMIGHSNNVSHGDIIRANLQDFHDRYEKVLIPYESGMGYMIGDYRAVAEQFDLLGRVGKKRNGTIISFWNHSQKIYDKLLYNCIDALKQRLSMKEPIFISTPIHGTIPIDQIDTKVDNDKARHLADLHRQLHLMRPELKNRARQELGLLQTSKKNDWQDAIEKTGAIKPGHKWWAMTSESVDIFDNLSSGH